MNENLASLAAEAMRTHEAKEERRKLRDWVHYAIGAGFALALFIAAFNAIAAPMFKNTGGDGTPVSLRLLDTPCVNEKVLKHLHANVQEKFIPKFKAAVLHYGGKDWASCWILYGQAVLSYDEEGEPFNPPYGVPRSMFKEDSV